METPSARAGRRAASLAAANAADRADGQEPDSWKEVLDRIFPNEGKTPAEGLDFVVKPPACPASPTSPRNDADPDPAATSMTPPDTEGLSPEALIPADKNASVEALLSPAVPEPIRRMIAPAEPDMPVIASVARVADPLLEVSSQARQQAFAALDHAHHQVMAAECAELIAILYAAQLWHVNLDEIDAALDRSSCGENLRSYGHDGTPQLGEYLALEIGPLLGITPRSAVLRIGEALDLAYRLPQTLHQVLAGNIRVWQAVKASEKCKELPLAAALEVDAKLARALRTMTPGRANKHLDEWIISADPVRAQQRVEAKRNARFLRISPIEDGHVSIYGIMDADEGILFDHILKQVAAVLPHNLDTPDSFTDHNIRRAQALGHLCREWQQPAQLPDLSNGTLPQQTETSRRDPHPDATAAIAGQPTHNTKANPSDNNPMPTHILVVHINAADPALTAVPVDVARIDDWGPLLTARLPEFLKDSKVIVRPIIDPSTIEPTDSYQVPDKMRFAIEQRNPVDVFPYGTTAAKHCDQDHTIPYSKEGREQSSSLELPRPTKELKAQSAQHSRGMNARPGQTRLDNLGPLSRTTHRAKTHGGWKLEQPSPGHYTWTSRLGYQYSVTPAGTTR